MIKKIFFLLLILVFSKLNFASILFKKDSLNKLGRIYGGLRIQKAVGFYWYNGITAEYSNQTICSEKLSLGLNFLSSAIGTAFQSNGIKFHELDIFATYHFRVSKKLQPYTRLNLGYAKANFNKDIYSKLPNQSLITSVETGLSYEFKIPVKTILGGGYNIIQGNGMKGLGVIYPVYWHLSFVYRFIQ